MTSEYPLQWPEGWPRTEQRSTSQFRTTLNGALNNVRESLRLFAKDSGKELEGLVISSNVTLTSQKPDDPGIAIYFTWDSIQTCIAVDRYKKVEDNLQAIRHCIEAERTKLRHGGINLVRASFRGFAALPPPGSSMTKKLRWWEILGVYPDADAETIKRAFRKKADEKHPDHGGTEEEFKELQAARQEGLKQAKGDAA